MARRAPEFMEALGVEITAHSLYQTSTASRFFAVSADAKSLDGKNISAAFIDELHLHKNRKVYDSLETGTAKREQSLLFVITTAGTDLAGICYELRTYITKILSKVLPDESTFGLIYTIPENYDWFDPAAWNAANPAMGTTVMPEVVKQLCQKALSIPAAENNFKTKHLNVWCNASDPWMNMDKWFKNTDTKLKIEDFEGEDCIIGLDLAYKYDLCAKTYLFQKVINKKTHYYIFCKAYLPEDTVNNAKNSQYSGWEKEGLLDIHPGAVIDYSMLEQDILDDCKKYNVLNVGFDPCQANQLSQNLSKQSVPMIIVRQNAMILSEPMKEIMSTTLDNTFHHNNKILDWCISNVCVQPDRNDNIFPRKEREENKIDLAVSTIDAMAVCITNGFTKKSNVYEDRDLFVI